MNSELKRFLPYAIALTGRARALRSRLTEAEHRLWFGLLRELPARVYRQRPVFGFVVDFYCPAAKLIIELDDDSHSDPEQQEKDRLRDRAFGAWGIRILRFTNRAVLEEYAGICEKIQRSIEARTAGKRGGS